MSHLQRPALDELDESTLERVQYVFDWEQRCLRIKERDEEDSQAGDQQVVTIRLEDAFLPGRDKDVAAIRRVAKESLRLGPEALPVEDDEQEVVGDGSEEALEEGLEEV